MQSVLINQIAVNTVWFACVGGGAAALPWLGTMAAALWLSIYLFASKDRGGAIALIAIAGALGAIADVILIAVGAVSYPNGHIAAGLGPHWIVALWMSFATSLRISFGWLAGRPAVSLLLGAVFGPLAYYGGRKLGGVAFAADTTYSLIALAVVWAIAFPLLVELAQRLEGGDHSTVETAGA